MRLALLLIATAICVLTTLTPADPAPFPTFRAQEIDHSLTIGYAVKIADLNRDGKPDIIVVDKHRVIWFENPGKPDAPWKLHTILEGTTKPDNVCLDVLDIDGDGKLDIALGAGWNPPNTTEPGTIQWLKQPENIDEPWKMYPIGEEPSVHRMRFVEIDRQYRYLIVAPLHGKGATAKGNWMEQGPRLTIFEVPKDPTTEPWKSALITDELHVVHNFVQYSGPHGQVAVGFASYEGLTFFEAVDPLHWDKSAFRRVITGNQDHPNGSRGCSEYKSGHLQDGIDFAVTIEPWHGNQVVVYPSLKTGGVRMRHVIDTQLKWGHGLWCADLDGDGNDEIIVGVRDPFNEKIRSGVNVFRATDPTGTKWEKHVIDNGGVAVEDLACADLNGDGKIDIVAVGRATKNVKIYWNQGK